MKKNLKLGTRKSLLAWAQSSLVAQAIEHQNPHVSVELVGIVTRGDQITDVPLSKIEGKEFFVKEIDDALLAGEVDLTVHSMKDLSLERPAGICLGAVPQREDPRDIVVFVGDVMDRLQRGEALKVGTSSPRRLQNIPGFLTDALPQLGLIKPRLDFVEIRGNVNTRLSRLHEPAASERRLDGVVLALAGLSRLAQHESSRDAIAKLLSDTKSMVLPLTHSPTAPAQGALAIECRRDDEDVKAILSTIHDEASARSVQVERSLMAQWGGGCHQRFGISCVEQRELGQLVFKRGIIPGETYVDELSFLDPGLAVSGPVVDGMDIRAKKDDVGIDKSTLNKAKAVFLASPAAAPDTLLAVLSSKRLWCVGPVSWLKFAARGLWVEGCADGLGVDYILPTMQRPVLGLPALKDWVVLTHADAEGTWDFGKVLSPYKIRYELTDDIKQSLRQAKHVFWSSGSQFSALGALAAKDVVHACGAGKTAERLRQAGVTDVHIFPSRDAWRTWVAKGQERK